MNGAGTKLCVAGTMDDYVAVVDRAALGYQLLQGLGQKPYWVTSNKAGDRCFVSWSGSDQMSVIDYASGSEVARVDVGGGGGDAQARGHGERGGAAHARVLHVETLREPDLAEA